MSQRETKGHDLNQSSLRTHAIIWLSKTKLIMGDEVKEKIVKLNKINIFDLCGQEQGHDTFNRLTD